LRRCRRQTDKPEKAPPLPPPEPTPDPAPRRSHWLFAARLAAFANVLVSPAIYVYRNKVLDSFFSFLFLFLLSTN